MFTIVIPIADYLPRLLKRLDLPPVAYDETKDEATGLTLCTATVYFSKTRKRVRMFSASSPDGPKFARHLAASAVVHYLKEEFHFVVVDGNHRELAAFKGTNVDPSPGYVTYVSSMIEDISDPGAFVDFCATENLRFGTGSSCSVANASTNSGKDKAVNDEKESASVAVRKSSPTCLSPEMPAAKKLKGVEGSLFDKEAVTSVKTTFNDPIQENRALKKQVEQLIRQNAKLQGDLIEFKLKSAHFRDTKAMYLQITRAFFADFRRTEAADVPFNRNMPPLPEGLGYCEGP